MADSQGDDKQGITPLSLIGSVIAAAFGVQSRRNRERDFTKGNIFVFIAAGLIFTALFVGAVIAVVQLVLAKAS